MGVLDELTVVALRQIAQGAVVETGVFAVGRARDAIVGHFTDHADRLPRAFESASDRAWRALEVALAGEGWLERCRRLFTSADDKAFRVQVKAFLDTLDPTVLGRGEKDAFRAQCLAELRAARKAGLLVRRELSPNELAARAGRFVRYDDPTKLLRLERESLEGVAGEFESSGYASLARLFALSEGPPLVVVAMRFFFRREIEKDEQLFRSLAYERMEGASEQIEGLTARQEQGFASLDQALEQHSAKLDQVFSTVVEVYDEVLEVQRQLGMLRQELKPGHSFSIRGAEEKRLVRSVLERYRNLDAKEREELPALLNEVGKVEAAAGHLDDARRSFTVAAAKADTPVERAEAHHNAYRAALEQKAWDDAMDALGHAIELDPQRFAPFPQDRYEPTRILGAGGFGVVFLCRHRYLGDEVVAKALHAEGFERNLDEVFSEARALRLVKHPNIIDVLDCGYADHLHKTHPYILMEYFDGVPLDRQVREGGRLSLPELVEVARPLAHALGEAHRRGVLHRDVKPANVLVRQTDGGLQVKVIDFGLALGPDLLRQGRPATDDRSIVGSSVAGTLEYAAPEQLGRLPGVEVGPYSDVYGFGKTCCQALFGTTQPLPRHWRSLPETLSDLLEGCLTEDPQRRLPGFGEVQRHLDAVAHDLRRARGSASAGAPAEVAPTVASPRPPPVRPATEPAPDVTPTVEDVPAPPPRAPARPASRETPRRGSPAGSRAPTLPPAEIHRRLIETASTPEQREVLESMRRVEPTGRRAFLVQPDPMLMDLVETPGPAVEAGETPRLTRRWVRGYLASLGLRLPTARQALDASQAGTFDPFDAPLVLRDERDRFLLPDGQVGFPELLPPERQRVLVPGLRAVAGVLELRG